MPKIHTERDSRNYIGVSTYYKVINVYSGDNKGHMEAWLNAEEAKELISDLQRAVNEVEGKENVYG